MRRTRILIAVLILVAAPSIYAAQGNLLDQAKAAFLNAQKLESEKNASSRKRSETLRVIEAYQRVYLITPHTGYADDALVAVARLYEEMEDPADAIKTLKFMIRDYPQSPYKAAAERDVERLQGRGPQDSAAAEKKPDPIMKPEPPVVTAVPERPAERSGKNALVENIRYWEGQNSVRVVVDVSGDIRFTQGEVKNPDRIFVDISAAKLNLNLLNKQWPVQSGLLRQIRAGQFDNTTVRVVLDLGAIESATSFTLRDPDRLIIDVLGKGATALPRTTENPFVPAPDKNPTPSKAPATISAVPVPPQPPMSNVPAPAVVNAAPPSPAPASVPEPTVTVPPASAPPAVVAVANAGGTPPVAAANVRGAVPPANARGTPPVPVANAGGAPPVATANARGSVPVATANNGGTPPVPAVNAGGAPPVAAGNARGAVPPANAGGTPPVPAVNAGGTAPVAATNAAGVPPTPAKPTNRGGTSLVRSLGLKLAKVVIDAGHGGNDTGTIGPTGYAEKELSLDIARRLKALIETELGAEVVLTRTEDVFVPLESRTAIANQNQADLFISIHANSSKVASARGVETFYLNYPPPSRDALELASRENASSQASIHELQDIIKKIMMNDKASESRELAGHIQKAMASRKDAGPDRGVKEAPFVVLIGANMPSILAEIGFISNPQEERSAKTPAYRQQIAESLFKGIRSYAETLSGVKSANSYDKE